MSVPIHNGPTAPRQEDGNFRVTWLPTSAPQRPPPPKRSASVRWSIAIGAVLLAMVIGVGAYLLLGRSDDAPRRAQNPLDTYLHAKQLHETGRDVEAMALLAQLRAQVEDARLRILVGDLSRDIELAEGYGQIQQLIAEKSFTNARERLEKILEKHPDQKRARWMLQTVETASAQQPAPARATGKPATRASTSPGERQASRRVDRPRARRAARPKRSSAKRGSGQGSSSGDSSPTSHTSTAQQGRIRVESDMPAAIFVDGEPTGKKTPATLTVAPGLHQIEVRSLRDGISKRRRSLTVASDATERVVFTFAKRSSPQIDKLNPYETQ